MQHQWFLLYKWINYVYLCLQLSLPEVIYSKKKYFEIEIYIKKEGLARSQEWYQCQTDQMVKKKYSMQMTRCSFFQWQICRVRYIKNISLLALGFLNEVNVSYFCLLATLLRLFQITINLFI